MSWPAQLNNHPAYDSIERKCRRFMGVLDNEAGRLREDGVDLTELRQFIHDLWPRVEALEERARKDPTARAELAAEEARLDPLLQEKFARLVDLVTRYHPGGGSLTGWWFYSARWRVCVGEPRRLFPPDYRSDVGVAAEVIEARWQTPVYGVPWEKLAAFRDAIYALKLPNTQLHRDSAAWAAFICGLMYAGVMLKERDELPRHEFDDGLREATLEAWQDGVDCARREDMQEGLREQIPLMGSVEAGELYLIVVQTNRSNSVELAAWLHQWNYRDALVRLLVALGVRAPNEPYGGRIFQQIKDGNGLVVPLRIDPRLGGLVRGFVDEMERGY